MPTSPTSTTGLAAAGRTRADIDVCQGAEVAFAADEDGLRHMVAGRKKELAFSLGGMGSASTNYYNRAYGRQGWARSPRRCASAGRAATATARPALVTDEMVLATTLIGTEEMVRARLAVWRDAGVDTVRLYPAGDTLEAKLCHARPGDRVGQGAPNGTEGGSVAISRPHDTFGGGCVGHLDDPHLRARRHAVGEKPPEREVAARIAECRQRIRVGGHAVGQHDRHRAVAIRARRCAR